MKRLTLTALLAASVLVGCSSNNQVVQDDPPFQLYQDAEAQLNKGAWITAIEKLEALDSRYPFGAYSDQVQLDLIYAYYKNDDLALAEATIDRFMRMHPAHAESDWVAYMRGLVYMAQDRSLIHDILRMERDDRDPQPARKAFADFRRLLERYPNSEYAADAKARMTALKKPFSSIRVSRGRLLYSS